MKVPLSEDFDHLVYLFQVHQCLANSSHIIKISNELICVKSNSFDCMVKSHEVELVKSGRGSASPGHNFIDQGTQSLEDF